MKIKLLLSIFTLIFTFCIFYYFNNNVFAYSSIDTRNSSSTFPNPFNSLKDDLLKNAAQKMNIDTTIPSLNFGTSPNINLLDLKDLSGTSIIGALKALATLAIKLFLIVIQTVAAILKGLLPFLSG